MSADGGPAAVDIEQIDPTAWWTGELLAALDAELVTEGYHRDDQFGYDATQLVERGVLLLGAFRDRLLVGIGGVEVDGPDAELQRWFVVPEHRGTGVADALLAALLDQARTAGATVVRLATGVRQHAALRCSRRLGFRHIPRFGPYVDCATSGCLARDLAGTGT